MIKDYIKKTIYDNYRRAAEAAGFSVDEYHSLREWIECESQSDPGFFRFLFENDDLWDFGSNMTREQKREYEEYLNNL